MLESIHLDSQVQTEVKSENGGWSKTNLLVSRQVPASVVRYLGTKGCPAPGQVDRILPAGGTQSWPNCIRERTGPSGSSKPS